MKSSAINSQASKPLPLSFFQRQADIVASELIGKGLYVRQGKTSLLVEIVEVEAYLGSEDPASHAYRGITKRNWPMFEKGGTCYVYLSYGINFCVNVSTGPKGRGQAVLFRAARPISGKEVMARRRHQKAEKNLLNGPGKLTQALGIDLTYNGREFGEEYFQLVDLGNQYSREQIGLSSRIGISKATDLPLRYFLKESLWLSRQNRQSSN